MERAHWVTAAACLSTMLVDFLIGVAFFKVIRFPLSSIIIGLATTLLIDSRLWWTYIVAGILAVVSKAVITHRGKHYFNPTNFGVALSLLLIPYHTTAIPSLFGGLLMPSIIFACLGAFTIFYAKQLAVPLSWLAGFIFFAYIRTLISHTNLSIALVPALGPAFLIFTFHMISDPRTTPTLLRNKCAFGFLIAGIDAFFRYFSIPYGNFYALFICCAFIPIVRDWERAQGIEPELDSSYLHPSAT